MCGFAGVVVWDERYRVRPETLAAMSARLAHRGPDGEGAWLNHETQISPQRPQVALVHRRLAVIDPQKRADQPFALEEATKRRSDEATKEEASILVFNGEIYNYRDLRAELSASCPDYRWRTQCDTEVLLAAYHAWGKQCVNRFNGMFAFAIWDGRDQSLFLARDRMGEKPLFIAPCLNAEPRAAGVLPALAFASELSALRELPWFDAELRLPALHEYLLYGYVPGEMTIYTGAMKLRPGHWLQVRPGGWQTVRYFNAGGHFYGARPPDETLPQRTRRLIERSVRRRLVADVPLGCLLSGGIDSSIVAAAMVKAAGSNVQTFSIGFDDPRYDETPYARAVAEHLGTKHHQFIVRPDAAADLPRLAEVFGEPFADSSALPMHYLARETRGHVKVALSGDGGDELFGGYDRYRAMHLAGRIGRLPFPLRQLAEARLWQALPGVHPKSKLARLKRLQATFRLSPGERYARFMQVFPPEQLAALYGPDLRLQTDPQVIGGEWFSAYSDGRDDVEAAAALDRVSYLPGDLLTKVDRAAMLHNLEVRSAFMDHELVAFAGHLKTPELIAGGPKRLLREAYRFDLPAAVFSRPKMGFAVPIGQWFRADLRDMLLDHLFAANSFARGHFDLPEVHRLIDQHERGQADHAHRLYALLMLELWWRGERG